MSDVVLKRKPSERRALVARLRNAARHFSDGALFDEAADEIENLSERLEVSYLYQSVGDDFVKIDMPDDSGHMDGIYCRDVTIKAYENDDMD